MLVLLLMLSQDLVNKDLAADLPSNRGRKRLLGEVLVLLFEVFHMFSFFIGNFAIKDFLEGI